MFFAKLQILNKFSIALSKFLELLIALML